jgi:hypothetical protein
MWLFLSMVDVGNICGSEEPSYQRYHNKILVHHSRVHKVQSTNYFLGKGFVGFGYLVKDLIMVVDSYVLIPWVQKQPNQFPNDENSMCAVELVLENRMFVLSLFSWIEKW